MDNLQITNDQGKTTLSTANQTAVPSGIRNLLKMTPGDKLTWYVEKNGDIKIKISPKNFVDKYYGIGKSLYDGTNAQEYINQLRQDRPLP